jgi:hypothetical protein
MANASWSKPPSSKGANAANEGDLQVSKTARPKIPSDGDWIRAAKAAGVDFSGNPTRVLVNGDNPAALDTRNTPVHKYTLTDSGTGAGNSRMEIQNRLAKSRKD